MIHRPGQPISFHLDGVGLQNSFTSGSRESFWWLPRQGADGHLLLTNLVDRPALAWVTLTDNTVQKSHRVAMALGPRQVRRLSLKQAVQQAGLVGEYGGISVSMQEDAGAIHAALLLFDEGAGFSAILKMFDSGMHGQVRPQTLRAPMVALAAPDPGLNFPQETELQPFIFIRNTTSETIHAGMAVNWRTASSSQSGRHLAPSLALAPGQTHRVDLRALHGPEQIPPGANWATVSLSYEGTRGALVAVAASYDATGRYGTQSPFSHNMAGAWKGGKWHVDGTRNTLLTVGNAGEAATDVELLACRRHRILSGSL